MAFVKTQLRQQPSTLRTNLILSSGHSKICMRLSVRQTAIQIISGAHLRQVV